MTEEELERLEQMIVSSDNEGRRLGLTIIFESWDDMTDELHNHLRIMYFTNMILSKGKKIRKSLIYGSGRSIDETIEDIQFVIKHVCQDRKILDEFFMFSLDSISKDINKL